MQSAMLRRWAIPAAVMMLFLNVAFPATAADDERVSNNAYVHKSDYLCVWNKADIVRAAGAVQSEARVESSTRKYWPGWGWVNCTQNWVAPPGHLAVKLILLAFIENEWRICREPMNWLTSMDPTDVAWAWWNWGGDNPPLPPCGTAWYATNVGGMAYNGGWYGGWIPSGNMWFVWPYSLAAKAGPKPAPPVWMNHDGTVDQSRLPERLPIAGADGHVTGTISAREVFGPPQGAPGTLARSTLPAGAHVQWHRPPQP